MYLPNMIHHVFPDHLVCLVDIALLEELFKFLSFDSNSTPSATHTTNTDFALHKWWMIAYVECAGGNHTVLSILSSFLMADDEIWLPP